MESVAKPKHLAAQWLFDHHPNSKKKMQYTHFMWGPSHQVYTYSVCPPYTRNPGIFNRAWQICKQRRLTMPTISAFGRRVPRWMESSIPFARWCDIHDLLRQTATSRTHLLAPFWQIRAFLETGVVAHTHTRKKKRILRENRKCCGFSGTRDTARAASRSRMRARCGICRSKMAHHHHCGRIVFFVTYQFTHTARARSTCDKWWGMPNTYVCILYTHLLCLILWTECAGVVCECVCLCEYHQHTQLHQISHRLNACAAELDITTTARVARNVKYSAI